MALFATLDNILVKRIAKEHALLEKVVLLLGSPQAFLQEAGFGGFVLLVTALRKQLQLAVEAVWMELLAVVVKPVGGGLTISLGEHFVPVFEVLLELLVILLVLVVVEWCLQDIISFEVPIAFFIQDHITVSLEVVVPKVLGHLSSLLPLEVGEVADAGLVLASAAHFVVKFAGLVVSAQDLF